MEDDAVFDALANELDDLLAKIVSHEGSYIDKVKTLKFLVDDVNLDEFLAWFDEN